MLSKIKELEQEALSLPIEDRALLVEHLINSLDTEEDPEVERLWIAETERRYKEYKEGKVKAIPAEEVFKAVRSRLK